MARLKVIPEEHATYDEGPKEWTTWHTNLQKLLTLVHDAVEEDHAKRQSARKCGNAISAELD